MNIPQALETLLAGNDLSAKDMHKIMRAIMTGGASPAQIGAFLVALRAKGETVEEVAAAAEVLREMATKIEVTGPHVIDTCGTGGDGAHTFNISTTAAFVVAATGGQVAKHGNRSVSSSCGSADVLEAAGVNLDLTPEQVKTCIERVGVGFLFAQRHHGAMKHAIGPRKEIAIRTLFNLLGPLTNPASAPNQLLGVFAKHWVEPMAKVLQKLGSSHVLVVHAEDGLDEISIASPTYVAELKNGGISTYTVTPERFGIHRNPLKTLAVETAEDSLKILLSVLEGRPGPAADIVALNAGAAIYAANLVENLEDGVLRAQAVIAEGHAKRKLAELVELSRSFA
ncbi:MAG: anthranilate phosphoribosyltransferase [Methylococcaceae bacterium]|nr:anthranilate phosphoribosyltransferase [Methylococcaceae bacterium]